jgi:hypothetical protein
VRGAQLSREGASVGPWADGEGGNLSAAERFRFGNRAARPIYSPIDQARAAESGEDASVRPDRNGAAPRASLLFRSEFAVMRTSLEQAMAIQVWITEGVDRAAEAIRETHAFDTDLYIDQTRCHRLSEISEADPVDHDIEWKACVLLPFTGEFRGAAALSMSPDEALGWAVADGSKQDIVGTFLELGGKVLGGIIEAAQALAGPNLSMGCPRFREDSLTGCLLSTHAPSDTVAIRSLIRIRAGGRDLEGQLHVLMEPKSMSRLLGALSVSLH